MPPMVSSSARAAGARPTYQAGRACTPSLRQQQPEQRPRGAACRGIGDDLLDYIQAGPKMRRWYGETEKLTGPKDRPAPEGGGGPDDEQQEDSGPRDAILVTGAETPLGELIVLQLVLARLRIRVLVKDAAKVKQEFGPYVEAVQGDVMTGSTLKEGMRGARAVVMAGATGQAVRAAAELGAEHIVLASSAEGPGGVLGGLFGGADAATRDPAREEEVAACGVAHTILRFGKLVDRPGGSTYLEFSQAEGAAPGAISREDAALVCARALAFPPKTGQGVAFTVGAAGPGKPPSKDEWAQMFGQLKGSGATVASS